MEPTRRQKAIVNIIAEELGIGLPKEYTKKAYSKFIRKYKEAYLDSYYDNLEPYNFLSDEDYY